MKWNNQDYYIEPTGRIVGYISVVKHPSGWVAVLVHPNKVESLGTFISPETARTAVEEEYKQTKTDILVPPTQPLD